MIDFELTEEQSAIQDMARSFVEEQIMPIALEYDEAAELPWEVIRKAHAVGLMNLTIPEEYGGQGLDNVTGVLILEEMGAGCLGIESTFAANILSLTPIVLGGTEEQKRRFVLPICREPKLAAFALTEPNAGSDAAALTTSAVRKADGYVLNGRKCFITNAGAASQYTVFATMDKSKGAKGITAFVVPAETAGLSVGKKENKMGDRSSQVADVILEDVFVPLANRIGEEGEGYKLALATLSGTRIQVASAAVGIARRAMEEAVKYAVNRQQFGSKIIDFQAIQMILADMAAGVETSRLITWKAAWLMDQGKPATLESAVAKCYAADMAMKTTTDAVQVLGGYGYIKDYNVEKLMRDAKITQIYEGSNQIQRLIIAQQLIKKIPV